MKITHLKTNHIVNPLGFALEKIRYQVSPSALRVFENHRRIGMNMLLKYRKLSPPDRGL